MIEYGAGNLRIPQLTRPVFAIAVGMTDSRRFYPQKQTIELVIEALKMAVVDGLKMSPMEFKGLPNFNVYSHFADHLSDQLLEAAKLHGEAGFNPIGNVEIKTGGATGGFSILTGIAYIASGIASLCPVIGWERMDEVDTAWGNTYIAYAADKDFETWLAERYTTYYDVMNTRVFHEQNPPREVLAQIASKNHYYAMFSPFTQQPGNYSPERIMKMKPVSGKLTPAECCAMSVGATCMILADEETAFKLTDKPVRIAGVGAGTDTLRTADRRDHIPVLLPNECPSEYENRKYEYPGFANFEAPHFACYQAYNMAGIKDPVEDLDVVEDHDAFSISTYITLRDMGIKDPAKFIQEGNTHYEGKLPMNLSGGLIGGTHAVGQTGIWQLAHIFWQIRHEWEAIMGNEKYWTQFGKRKPKNFRNLQVEHAKRGMGISHAGTGSHASCIILERGW